MGSPASSPEAAEHPLIGAEAPAFELPDPTGKQRVALSMYAGKVVIVDFWATWCEPCRQSFPEYQKLLEEFGSSLAVIGISVDEAPDGISAFAQETGVKFPLAWDEGQAVAQAYAPKVMPTSFFVDRNGIVRAVHSGFHSGDEKLIKSQVQALLR